MAKIGSPLFILREECGKDLFAVLEKLAEIGYEGVEFLGFFGHKPRDIKKKLDSCGLIAVGNHVAFDELAEKTDKVIEEHKELGCGFITIGMPKSDGLPGGDNYARAIWTGEKIGEAVKNAGMKMLYHNHADELKRKVNNKTILENILDDICPDLLYFEPDLGWMSIGGADPAYYLNNYKNRYPVVHFKDYMPKGDGFVFRPTGYGIMKNAELYAMTLNCDPKPEWYIMDHDCAYERDIYFDLKISLEYFKNLMILN